jgi:hypothetical protein
VGEGYFKLAVFGIVYLDIGGTNLVAKPGIQLNS